jgi:hypothetical protein
MQMLLLRHQQETGGQSCMNSALPQNVREPQPSSCQAVLLVCCRISELVRPSHSAGGPTAGLVAKTQELLQRFRDTPGDSFTERWVGVYIGGAALHLDSEPLRIECFGLV